MPAPDAQRQHDNLLAAPHNVPVQLTSLVGREREVAAICDLLHSDGPRLLTLTGPPGIGKTRLGIEACNAVRGRFAGGIYFVNLAPVTGHDATLQALAAALGIRQAGDQPLEEVLTRFLRGREALLLLDNFEHVLAAGPSVTALLRAAPRLKVITTSRELLRVSGEHDFPVPALSLPPVLTPQGDTGRYTPLPLEHLGDYESVQLFVQRAMAYKSDFALDEDNAHDIGAICRKLDGLPLAIELAAARIRHLSPQAILDRLQDRMALLTGGARDLPLRQRTLKATIEWSYDLLDEDEKRLFRRLAVFRGGRTLDAVEAVCDFDGRLGIDVLNGVASLVDKSLLQRAAGTGTAESGVPRYVMFETIQEYAEAKLQASGELEALERAHAAYFTQLAEQAEPELHGPRQLEWLDRLESEQNNLQAALGWAYRDSPEVGLRLAAALNIYWNRRGYLILGREWASAMVARARDTGAGTGPDGPIQASLARALYTLGFIAFRQANYQSAHDFLDESVRTYRQLQARGETVDTRGLVESLNVQGIVKSRLENMDARRALHEQALRLARQAGDNWAVARSLYQLGHVARLTGDYAQGRALFEESLALFRQSGDKFNIGLALIGMGQMAERQGDYEPAHRLFEESLAVYQELGDKWGIAGALFCLGSARIHLRDYAGARAAFEEQLALDEELGATGDMAETLQKLGRAAYLQGDLADAGLLFKRGLSLFEELGDKMGIAHALMDLAGVVLAATREPENRSTRKRPPAGSLRAAQVVVAAQLLGAADALLEVVGFTMPPEDREFFDEFGAAARAQLGERAFGRAWAEGRGMGIDRAVASAKTVDVPGPQELPGRRSSRRAAASDFGGLTRREREVAVLVSRGKTNRVIAEELVVSERTVEGHVNNILAKLGFRSRAQVAAWVVEKRLANLTG